MKTLAGRVIHEDSSRQSDMKMLSDKAEMLLTPTSSCLTLFCPSMSSCLTLSIYVFMSHYVHLWLHVSLCPSMSSCLKHLGGVVWKTWFRVSSRSTSLHSNKELVNLPVLSSDLWSSSDMKRLTFLHRHTK